MKKVLNLSLVASTILVMLFCNCRDKTIYYKIPEDLLAYVDFLVGTYWKYQDSISGDTNKIELTKRGLRTNIPFEFETNAICDELFQTFMKNDSIEFSGFVIMTSANGTYFYENEHKNISFSLSCFEKNENQYQCYEPLPVYKDLILINNITYTNVIIFYSYEMKIKFYWAKDVGLIRTEEYESASDINGLLIQENLLRVENLIETNANTK